MNHLCEQINLIMAPEELNSYIELIPQQVKVAHINFLISDLRSGKSYSSELEKKAKLAVSFLSETPAHFTVDDSFYKELINTSLSYCWLNHKNSANLNHVLYSLICISNRCIKNRASVMECFLKHLNILSEKSVSPLNNSISEEDIPVYIFVLDCIADSVISDELFLKDIYSNLESACEHFLELALSTSHNTLGKFLLTFKKICNANNKNNLLEKNWELLKKKYQNSSHQNYHGISLFILCFLADFYIVNNQSPNGYPLYSDIVLWEIIQTGLIDDAPLIRKQSLYLLKRYINVLYECNNDFNSSLFHWNKLYKKEIIEYWDSYFILWEALEDKQIHLIMPALRKFEKIIEISSKQIVPIDWMYSLFIFCFKNESISIIKSSLLIFFSVDVNLFLSYCKFEAVFYYLFSALNNMQLYSNSASPNESNFREYLGAWFQNIASKNILATFSVMISVLGDVNLSSVPIFYITNEIKTASWNIKWNSSSLKILEKLIKESSRGQNVKIRGGVQCLTLSLISNYFQHEDVSIEEIADFFTAFSSSESLKRGTRCWSSCASWIAKLITSEKVIQFLENSYHNFSSLETLNSPEFMSLDALARIIVLLEDASLITELEKLKMFQVIFDNFANCDKRMYINTQMQDICFEFICRLLIESIPLSQNENFVNGSLRLINDEFSNLATFLCLRLKFVSSLDDLEVIDTYLKFIEIAINHYKLFSHIHQNFIILHNSAIDILKKEKLPPIQEYFALKFENLFQKYIKSLDFPQYRMLMVSEDEYLSLFHSRLLKKHLIMEEILNLPISTKRHGGKIISGSIQSVWSIFYHFLSSGTNGQSILDKIRVDDIFQEGLETLNIGGKESVIWVLKVFGLLMPYCKNSASSEKNLEFTWETCFEYRKTDLFWKAIEEWMFTAYQECTLGDINYHKFLLNYGRKTMTMGNDIFGLANLLIERLHSQRYLIDLSPFADIIVSCLLFGPLLHKDQRIEKEVFDIIEDMGEELAINILKPELSGKTNLEVRILSLNMLLDKKIIGWNKLIKHIVLELINSYKESCKSKRYFNDSLVHRKRNRILQVLLTLHCLIVKDANFRDLINELTNFVTENLLGESQQPSIRYQLEWLYILLVFNSKESDVWNSLTQASSERLGSVCSFISIAYHLVRLKRDSSFFEQFIENVLPWSMSQNFNIRLYAQVTLKKLWPLFEDVSLKYGALTKNQWKIYQQGNMLLNAKKLETDFYFDCFHPFEHYSLQTIFYDLPRLSNVSCDEWATLTYMKKIITDKPVHLKWGDERDQNSLPLAECAVPNWVMKSEDGTECKERSSLQKKFTPWKGMFPQELEPDMCQKPKGELILVASLIDKMSNLGGLARTCDVFGVKEFVIDSLNFVNDKQFVSLSMTAEKHINITEVKTYHLSDYVNKMKKIGYIAVGAEQTTGSIPLSDYKFQKKTLLILGNEREGIPVNVLPFLDACIEIPQYGLIRSLNVHVSGAIFLWEYVKQQYKGNI